MPRIKIYVFLTILLVFLFIFAARTKANSLPLLGKVIFVDAGHGGIG